MLDIILNLPIGELLSLLYIIIAGIYCSVNNIFVATVAILTGRGVLKSATGKFIDFFWWLNIIYWVIRLWPIQG